MSLIAWKITLWVAPIVGILLAALANYKIHVIENTAPEIEVQTEVIAEPVRESTVRGSPSETMKTNKLQFRIGVRPELKGHENVASMGVIFFDASPLYSTESQLASWMTEAVRFGNRPDNHRILHRAYHGLLLSSSDFTGPGWVEVRLSPNHTPWKAAVYVFVEGYSPQWYQLSIAEGDPASLKPSSGQGVSVRNYPISSTKTPEVSAGDEPHPALIGDEG